MDVNHRMLAILDNLFASDGRLSVQGAIDVTGLSRRSLLYHIDKLNAFFREINISPIDLCRGVIRWDVSQREAVQQALEHQQSAVYVLSKSERKAVVVIWTAVSSESVTLDSLAALLDVSRNTVVTEIGELKAELARAGLTLNSYGHSGYTLEGEEATIRYYVMECLYGLPSGTVQRMAQEQIVRAAGRFRERPITSADYRRLCDIVAESERQTSLRLNNNSIREAASYLLLILTRSGAGRITHVGEDLHGRSEYAAAGTILRLMEEMGLHIPPEEQGYITTVLLASKVFDIDWHPGSGGIDLEAFARDLVDTFSAKACVRFEDRDALVSRLLPHVRPMYYRLKYKIKVRNVLIDEIRGRYRELYNLTDLAVKTVEPRYGLSIPDDEIAYLCVYIGGWMKRQLTPDGAAGGRILIVCGAGIGTSLLLRDQLTSLLGPGYRYETKDERESGAADCLDYDLVVTTVELDCGGANILRVSPILTQSQQNKLLAWSAETSGGGDLQKVGDLLDIVRRHAVIHDEDALTNALLSYLARGKAGEGAPSESIADVLLPGHVEIIDAPMDAEEAIRRSCRPLVDEGLVGPDYPGSILEIINSLGLYAEIADGILLAHGASDETVSGVGLTLSLFRTPVPFPKWDKDIRVIFTLSSPDNESHLFILRDIMALIKRPDTCGRLAQCGFTDAREVRDFIVRSLEP